MLSQLLGMDDLAWLHSAGCIGWNILSHQFISINAGMLLLHLLMLLAMLTHEESCNRHDDQLIPKRCM